MNLSRLQRVAHMSEARCGGESAQDPGCCFAYPGLRFLLRYAQQLSWREDNRRVSNGDQTRRVAGLALKRGESGDFTGYRQRHKVK